MKFLILTPDFPLWDGGVAAWAEKLSFFLTRSGHDVHVATPLQLPGDPDFDARQHYHVTRLRNLKDRYFKYAYSHLRLGSLFKNGKYDHLIALTWFPYANAALRLAPATPLTLFAHGNDFLETRWQQPFWKPRMHQAFSGASRIIAVSRETERALHETIPGLQNRVHVLFPAVDPNEFPPVPPVEGPPVLLSLGRVVSRKGQDMVIRALPAILTEFPDTEYWIAGRGADTERLKSLVAELGLQSRVRFLGLIPQEERVKLYQRCTVYLMPSRTIANKGDFEGFGITYLEANSCEKPVIGGRSGGVADAVVDGVTGFLVDPNSFEEISERTLQLLRNPALANQMGRQGRERVVSELNWEKTTGNFLKLLANDQ
ncbi:MAG: glycosyltransferase family 4 protein [Verrucomicrobiota bacterium]